VFNFETKKNHTYIAEGCVVHNCDTSFTWLTTERRDVPDNYHRYSKKVVKEDFMMEMTPKELANKIIKLLPKETQVNIIFTGGEPLLQSEDIIKTIDCINKSFSAPLQLKYEVETNGTAVVERELAQRLTYINCSPKLSSSGNIAKIRDNEKAINSILNTAKYRDVAFKFVVHPDRIDEDMKEIIQWAQKYDVPKNMIWLMPEGITKERIMAGSDKIWKYAYTNGYNFTTRLHILLYGSKRAV